MFPTRIVKFLLMHFYFRIEQFVQIVAQQYDKKGKELLDVGAEHSPYRKYFHNLIYVTSDAQQNEKKSIDVIADFNKKADTIKDGSFDYILCTQVLEHLQNPHIAFAEFYRILKPGGKVFLTTNFIYQIHMEPYDYFRFTKYGLVYLGESAGFHVEHIKPHGGIFHVLSYIIATIPIRLLFDNHPKIALAYIALFSPIIAVLNLLAIILDTFDRHKKLTSNYEVIYRKDTRREYHEKVRS